MKSLYFVCVCALAALLCSCSCRAVQQECNVTYIPMITVESGCSRIDMRELELKSGDPFIIRVSTNKKISIPQFNKLSANLLHSWSEKDNSFSYSFFEKTSDSNEKLQVMNVK